jgi:hypothetical protein
MFALCDGRVKSRESAEKANIVGVVHKGVLARLTEPIGPDAHILKDMAIAMKQGKCGVHLLQG